MNNEKITIAPNKSIEPIIISSELKSDNVGISISSWNKDKKITEEMLKDIHHMWNIMLNNKNQSQIGWFLFIGLKHRNKPPVLPGEIKRFSKNKNGELKASRKVY